MPYVKLSKTVEGWGAAWDVGKTVFVSEGVARDLLKEQFGELITVPTDADLSLASPAADVQTLSEKVETLPGATPAEPIAVEAEPAPAAEAAQAPAAAETGAAPAA